MRRRSTVLIAALVVLLGLGGAWIFKHAPRAATSEQPSPSNASDSQPNAKPRDGRLLGRIEWQPQRKDGGRRAEGGSKKPPPPSDLRPPPSLPPPAATVDTQPAKTQLAKIQPAETQPAVRPAPVVVRHTVRDGDTLRELARKYLGSTERFLEIFDANDAVLSSPDLLPIGVELRISIPDESRTPAIDEQQPPMVPIPPGAWRRARKAP